MTFFLLSAVSARPIFYLFYLFYLRTTPDCLTLSELEGHKGGAAASGVKGKRSANQLPSSPHPQNIKRMKRMAKCSLLIRSSQQVDLTPQTYHTLSHHLTSMS